MNAESQITFGGLVDLAAARMGGVALATSDDFFAGMENLLKDAPAVFLPDEYTDRGKWMDGWESRRKRTPGHDWCIVRLGVPGRVRALDIDTAHFLGNNPAFASVEALCGDPQLTVSELWRSSWTPLLEQSRLLPGAHNLFTVQGSGPVTHLRLNIFPDGGVARLRVYGEVEAGWHARPDDTVAAVIEPGEVDLAALKNGARALGCSDAFFGPMDNLIAPGRAANMGGGWESRRRRGPGEDWIVIRLAAPGTVSLVELDTAFFKGNFPDRVRLEGIHAPDAPPTQILWGDLDWRLLLPSTKLAADTRHFLRDDLAHGGPYTHVRLTIVPDGGISRMRLYGRPE